MPGLADVYGIVVTLTFNLFTLIYPNLQNHPKHIQFNWNFHHLMSYGDKMAPKVDTLTTFGLVVTFWPQNLISSPFPQVHRSGKFGEICPSGL